jgi:hypothetical protein
MNYIPFVVVAPAVMLAVGFAFGICLPLVRMSKYRLGELILAVWATGSGGAIWYGSVVFKSQLSSIAPFAAFVSLIKDTQYSTMVYGDIQQTALAALLGMYELGILAGYGTFVICQFLSSQNSQKKSSGLPASPRIEAATISTSGSTAVPIQTTNQSINRKEKEGIINYLTGHGIEHVSESKSSTNTLSKEERTIIELFLFGRVSKITPRIDLTKPEGYFFEGAAALNLDTGRLKQILDSLTRRGLLDSELSDKILTCKSCDSPNVQLKNLCPVCNSMNLSKHNVLEHFACGFVERQEHFQTPSGDLVCPKCHAKLHMVGSDYRNLSQMYVCVVCNSRNKDLLQIMKCAECSAAFGVDEENEQYLYAYTLNEHAAQKMGEQIKPIAACTAHFRSLGYTVVSPAFVIGRSGTQHVFDVLILGGLQGISTEPSSPYTISADSNGNKSNMVVEIIVSNNQVELEQITRVYGKICDIGCESLIVAIPGPSENVRNYAAGFNINLVEGRTIDEALARLSVPPVGT